MDTVELVATATFGLEAVVAREVRDLGYEDVTVENGRVTFKADSAAICRANLWLRTADRILVKMGTFQALTFDELFERTKALPWDDWISADGVFPVQGRSIKSKLFSVPDCQGIVKKAVVERLKQRHRREWFPETGPRYAIEVALLKDTATLTIDTSGAGLHKRGYRKLASPAPLKETLAAALVLLSRWHPDRPFIDPLCGSGTIPIEAALIGLNIAPGLGREFAAQGWPVLPAALWKEARVAARHAVAHDREIHVEGSDIDGKVLSLARYHAREAGVDGQVTFYERPLARLDSPLKYGWVVINPPYGERLSEQTTVEKLYRELGNVAARLDSWSFYVLAAHRGLETLFGRPADKKRKLYNGRIECHFYQFFGPKPPR